LQAKINGAARTSVRTIGFPAEQTSRRIAGEH